MSWGQAPRRHRAPACARPRVLGLAALLLALAGLLPPGWMPRAGAAGLELVICTAAGPVAATLDPGANEPGADDPGAGAPGKAGPAASCPAALAKAPAPPLAPAVAAPSALRPPPAPLPAPAALPAVTPPVRLPPPHAPPASA